MRDDKRNRGCISELGKRGARRREVLRKRATDRSGVAVDCGLSAVGNQQSARTNSYTWGNDLSGSLQGAGGVGGLLAVCIASTCNSQPVTCNSYYPLYDHNGNVERYVARNGATVASFQYDAFGNTVASALMNSGTHERMNFSFRFSTKYWDVETGLVMFQLRSCSPALGCWMCRDKFGELGGIGLLTMLRNDLINDIDYLGLMSMNDWGKPPLAGLPRLEPYDPYRPPTIGPAPAPSVPPNTPAINLPSPYGFPRPGDFRHHGNWGGPGWAAGRYIPEGDLKESDFKVFHTDDRDLCYKNHDRCIWECHRDLCNKNDDKLNKCIRSCDYKLSICLYKIPRYNPSFYMTSQWAPLRADIEAGLFLEPIPFVVHGGLQALY